MCQLSSTIQTAGQLQRSSRCRLGSWHSLRVTAGGSQETAPRVCFISFSLQDDMVSLHLLRVDPDMASDAKQFLRDGHGQLYIEEERICSVLLRSVIWAHAKHNCSESRLFWEHITRHFAIVLSCMVSGFPRSPLVPSNVFLCRHRSRHQSQLGSTRSSSLTRLLASCIVETTTFLMWPLPSFAGGFRFYWNCFMLSTYPDHSIRQFSTCSSKQPISVISMMRM